MAASTEYAGTTWQDTIAELQSLLADSSHETDDGEINLRLSSLCSTILDIATSSDGDAVPESVLTAVRTTYLRALLNLGEYSKVVEFHDSSNNNNGANIHEVAYALYRLRKYDACRKLIVTSTSANATNMDEGENESKDSMDRVLMHIYAQTLYRLGETNEADQAYSKIINSNSEEENDSMDADEREDTLSNALANRIANYTPGSMLQEDGTTLISWLEEDESIRQLIDSYAQGEDSEEGGEILHNYDLAYNLATFMLVSSDARSQSHVVQAKRLLEQAEKSALTILESTEENDDNNDDPEGGEEEEKAEKEKMLLLAEREAGPIRANLALANILMGGEDNEMDALRTYLTLLTKTAKSGNEQGNLLASSSNNLALLRDGKESVFDVLKRIPITSSLSVSENGVSGSKGGGKKKRDKGGGGVSNVPLVGATPQQVRTALFNRALLFAKMGNTNGCMEALDVFRASLLVSYHGDDSKTSRSGFATNGKKKKKTPTSSDDVPTARPSSDAEVAAWVAQTDLLESELVRISESKGESSDDIVHGAIQNLDKAINAAGDKDLGALSYSKSQLLLHKAALSNEELKIDDTIEALETLPTPMQSCAGVKITLASLYGSSNNDDKAEQLLSGLGDDIALAEFRLGQGQYQQAIELLEGILDEQGSDAPMEVMAMLVKALSYTDPDKAEEVGQSLLEATSVELDGEALESMEIPRFAKKAGDSSSKVRKTIAATGGGKGRVRLGERKKKNRDVILRKRAKQREAFLSKLEAEGRYDPKQNLKPDPERWIPKSQRSYNRRGRRSRNKGTGAQGGGAGAGMEKDAAKLDVAARLAANESSSGPSTANMKVSSSGNRKGKGGRRR